jgi:hypothetical protein
MQLLAKLQWHGCLSYHTVSFGISDNESMIARNKAGHQDTQQAGAYVHVW